MDTPEGRVEELERELAKAHASNQAAAVAVLRFRDALQAIADETEQHHEHNPVSGKDRLPKGYVTIRNLACNALES